VNHIGVSLVSRAKLAAPRCAYCDAGRPWTQWLALPASLVGRDGCVSCGAPLAARRGLIEIALGATYALLWVAIGPSLRLLLFLIYGTILALILVTDLERRRIPDVIIYPAIALAAVAAFFTPGLEPGSALAGGLVGFAVYLVISLVGKVAYGPGAMGMGDVKLATFIGLIVGFPLIISAIVAAILSAGLTGLVLLVTRLRGRRDPIPYAPFLIAGTAVAAIWGSAILRALLS
jgi:leader peptidase (prepilin peptidase)/N-methyltransferase